MRSLTLAERLVASRERLTLSRIIEGASWAGLAAVSLFGVLKLVGYLAPIWPSFSFLSGGIALVVSGVALLTGLAVTLVRVRKTRPSLLAMARRADRHFGLDERLATAVEFGMLEGPADRSSPVLLALFRDAAARGEQVNSKLLVPLSVPRQSWYILALFLLLITVDLAVPPAWTGPDLSDRRESPVPVEAAGTVELILETAALLREEAERLDSDYMRVVATAMETLAREIVEQGLSDDAIGEELARLVAHAELASRGDPGGPATELPPTTSSGAEGLPWEEMRGEPGGADRRDVSEPGGTSPFESGATLAEARSALEALLSQLDAEAQEGEQLAEGTGSAGEAGEAETEPSGSALTESEMGEMTGGGANPSLGPPSFAEGGVGESASELDAVDSGLFSGSPVESSLQEASSTLDFELPSEGGSRRRLPIEIVPETNFSVVLEAPLPQGDWRDASQERVSPDFLGLSYRDVARRYFLSLTRDSAAPTP